jgi:hypothetical protein
LRQSVQDPLDHPFASGHQVFDVLANALSRVTMDFLPRWEFLSGRGGRCGWQAYERDPISSSTVAAVAM